MITLNDIERILKAALKKLLDQGIDLYTSVKYILRLLLLKRLLDQCEEYEYACDSNHNRNLEYQKNEELKYKKAVFMPHELQWKKLLTFNENLGKELNRIFELIEQENPKLRGVFITSKFHWDNSEIENRALIHLIFDFSYLNLKSSNLATPDLLGQAFKYLIEIVSTKTGEIYTTPETVVKLLVNLLEPQQELSICDPTCGTASFLVEFIHQIQQQDGNSNKILLYGQEINPEIYALAKINLLLNDIYNFDLCLGDIIRNPQLVKNSRLQLFDRIVANPPFNVSRWGEESTVKQDKYYRFCYGIPPKNSGDFAFIQHILSTLNQTGKAGFIGSTGILFRGGIEGEIRRLIIRDDLIEAVISLAHNLLSYTSIPIVILIFNRNKSEDRKGKILLIDASDEYEKDNRRSYLHQDDIAHIVSAYQAFRNLVSLKDKKEYAKVVSHEELASNDYSLNISRYMEVPKIQVTAENIQAEIANLSQLETERVEAEEQMNECLRVLGIEL